jgi:hypothetical protein
MSQSKVRAVVTKRQINTGDCRYQKATPTLPPYQYFQTVENFCI